jgi:serine/threonine protein kinase
VVFSPPVTARPDPFCLAGEILEGKYRVDHFVAEGGFGAVYAGHHLRLDVPIAVKVLKTNRMLSVEARATIVSRFLDEARTTARLAHPNITRAMDTGVLHTEQHPEGLPWLALEWLDGHTLESELDDRRGQGGRTPRETFELLGPVIDAIAYAHARGVVHRDLKPSNVMLVEERGRLSARILDFGIAKLAEPSFSPPSGQTTTESSMVAFSPGYAAPEQVSRARTGPWTDVHALGLLLTEVLTDESPYGADDGIQVLSSILSSERPTPERRGHLLGPWETEIRRAVALNPRDRHKDAGELLRALADSLEAAETVSRANPKPQGHVRTAVARTSPEGMPASKTDVVVPSRSTTVPNTSAVFPSQTPPKPPPRAPIAIGLGITAVLLGAGVFAIGSMRSSNNGGISPVPSAEAPHATAIAPRAHSVPDAGAATSPHVAPVASSGAPSRASESAPAPSALEVVKEDGHSGVSHPHRADVGKPPHAPTAAASSAPPGTAATAKERLTPTSSFE